MIITNLAYDLQKEPNIIWESNPGGQRLAETCPYREVLNEGPRGGGKTDWLLEDFGKHVGKGYGPNWRGILFRETFPQLKDIIAKSKKMYYRAFIGAKYNGTDHCWTWPEGETLYLSYMRRPEDYWNYHGHEYPWIGWEEICNWIDNQCYELMKNCNRSSFPDMPRRYVSTANPYGKGHQWVKAYFIDPAPALTPIPPEKKLISIIKKDKKSTKDWTRIRIRSYWWECKQLMENDPEYIQTLLTIKDPTLRRAWLLGDWDIVAGGALVDVWNPMVHFITPFQIPKSWHIDRSFDWGSTKPFSVGWWAESDGSEVEVAPGKWRTFPKGTVFRIAEWYGWNGQPNTGLKMLSSEIARKIKEIESYWDFEVKPGPADTSIFDAEDGQSIADKMRLAAGIQWTKADKRPGSRISGLEKVREMLSASLQRPMEDPGLFIFNTCRNWKRTVPVLPRDEKQMDDVDSDTEDHAYDETRYRVMDKRLEAAEAEVVGI